MHRHRYEHKVLTHIHFINWEQRELETQEVYGLLVWYANVCKIWVGCKGCSLNSTYISATRKKVMIS